jgi:hypothetical protein
MKRIKQKIIIATVGLILLIILLSFNVIGLASAESSHNYTHSWTKAICNENYCQDYEIYCDGDKLVSQTPITGAVMSIPKDWVDPRNESNRERVCE